jgi:hypothetical protein
MGLTVMSEAVEPVFHEKVFAPLTVSVAVLPAQRVAGLVLTTSDTEGITERLITAEAVQVPAAPMTV